MGYRLLIVDDEEWIRKGFLARLSHLNLEFDKIYEAGSGSEGLGVLEENSVDIIMTDIRMPDMDGLTFISRSRERHPGLKFLIVSGYAEFDYAKQAIHLGVAVYLLKPLSNDELRRAMEDIFLQLKEEERIKKAVDSGNRLQKEKDIRQFEQELNHLLQETVPEYRRQPGNELLPYPFLRKMCPWLADAQPGIFFFVGVFSIEEGNGKKRQEDLDLATFIVKNVFMELPGACRKTIACLPGDSRRLVAVFASSQAGFRAVAEAVYFKTGAVLEQILSMTLSLGVSGPLKRPGGKEGLEEAAESLKQRMVCGRPGIYFYEDVAALEAAPVPGVQLHMLRYLMEKNDREQIRACIHKILTEETAGTHRAAYLNMVWVRILSMVLSALHERNGENPQKIHALLGGFKEFDAMHTLGEMEQKLTEAVTGSLAADREESSSVERIRMAAAYIRENYNNPISVNWLAERFGMSPNYFSTMFKKETGQSAGSYITAMRIEKAKEMLAKNDQPATDIARETGYDDAQYFFRVFKRETGQTPIQYQSRFREEQFSHEK